MARTDEDDESNIVTFPYKGKIIRLRVAQFNDEMDLDRLCYIDLNNLLAEIVTFPTIMNRLGNMEAMAADQLRTAELNKRIAEAEFKDAVRQTPSGNSDAKGKERSWTEGQTQDKWYSSAMYKVKRQLVNKAQFRHELIKGAYWACKSKSDKLDVLSTQLTGDDLNNIKSLVINNIDVRIKGSVLQ